MIDLSRNSQRKQVAMKGWNPFCPLAGSYGALCLGTTACGRNLHLPQSYILQANCWYHGQFSVEHDTSLESIEFHQVQTTNRELADYIVGSCYFLKKRQPKDKCKLLTSVLIYKQARWLIRHCFSGDSARPTRGGNNRQNGFEMRSNSVFRCVTRLHCRRCKTARWWSQK
jgi:hypothetical protein